MAGRLDVIYENKNITLKKLGLIEKGKLLNAASILFSNKNILELQMAIFASKEKITFLDIQQLKGSLFKLLEEAEMYIKNHINWGVKFGKLEREEIPEIPIEAVREALVNSFCHRDYKIQKSNEIAIFKDRIEIYNPGAFPENYKPEDFIKGKERSILRNPLIAEMLYYSKDIEKWASGLKRIFELCNAADVRLEFELLKSGFLIIFYRKSAEKGYSNLIENAASKKSRKKKELTAPELHPNCTQTALEIFELIKGDKYITANQMSEKINLEVN